MNINILKTVCFVVCVLTVVSCGDNKNKDNNQVIGKSSAENKITIVDTTLLNHRTFNKQIVCNGKLRAVQKSDLNFSTGGIIKDLRIKNGDYIKKGDLLAMVDIEEANIELEKSRRALEKSKIDLKDKLISLGHGNVALSAVPEVVMNEAKNSSGYYNVLDQLTASERRFNSCYLYAPFSGRVADMDVKVHGKSGDKVCTLIDDSSFDVEFTVLEAEMDQVERGQKVKLTPFINEERNFEGVVTEVNPLIDLKGQVKIRAKVSNKDGYLVEGMNVKLFLEKEVENCFVVPKDAVVLRDGFQVVFKVVDGVAVWTYVDVVMSNINNHVITGNKIKQTSIDSNDIIIISNNANIADGTKVTMR